MISMLMTRVVDGFDFFVCRQQRSSKWWNARLAAKRTASKCVVPKNEDPVVVSKYIHRYSNSEQRGKKGADDRDRYGGRCPRL
jgi:hypothetical protein